MKSLNIPIRSTELTPIKLSTLARFPADKDLERRLAEARAKIPPDKKLIVETDTFVRPIHDDMPIG